MVMPEPRPSREAALAWVRGHCPDLEIQDGGAVGHRARATYRGRRLEVVVEGPDSREEIAYQLWLRLRQEMRQPARGHGQQESDDDVVRRIIEARVAGQHDAADGLERVLIARRTGVVLPPIRGQSGSRDLPPTAAPRQEIYLNPDRKVY